MKGLHIMDNNGRRMMEAVGKVFLREIRRQDLSDTRAAEICGVGRITLRRLLYAQSDLHLSIVYQISLGLKFPISEALRQAEAEIEKARKQEMIDEYYRMRSPGLTDGDTAGTVARAEQ